MFDGLSLVASVFTLTAAVVEIIKKVKSFYRAAEELGELIVCIGTSPSMLMLNYLFV